MNNSFKHLYVTLTCLFIFAFLSCRHDGELVDVSKKENISNIITAEMYIQDMNSIAFCAVKNDSLLWADAVGYADRDSKRKATADTRYLVASISKTVTAVALMQLYDRDLLRLDDDINDYLPFKIVHPHYPHDAITFRMLLNHTSSISDAFMDYINLYCFGFDCPTPLKDYIYDFFSPGGSNYSDFNFHGWRPGKNGRYSNNGYVLIGYLVEVLTGQSFDLYCKENIFEPLEMSKTEWRLANIPLNELAIPYSPFITPSHPHYTFIDYPDGGLRTTVVDLSKFLRMIIMNGSLNGCELIKPETMELMRQSTNEVIDGYTFGLGLLYTEIGNLHLCGHDGGEQGVTAAMFYDIDTNAGAIVFTNTIMRDLDLITNSLIQYGNKQQ